MDLIKASAILIEILCFKQAASTRKVVDGRSHPIFERRKRGVTKWYQSESLRSNDLKLVEKESYECMETKYSYPNKV